MHNFTKYFKETPGFDRFIMRLYEKYRSLSKFSGTVKLEHLTKQEAISLSRLFGTTYQEKETVSLSIKKFISIMENSKYDDFDIQILVQEYLNVSLVTKKEEKRMSKNEEMEFYQEIIENDDSLGSSWLKKVIEEKKSTYFLLQKRYHKNKSLLKKELTNMICLLNHLPKEDVLLPIYASTYTKDPHYLDLDGSHSNLFLSSLSYLANIDYLKTREEKIKLMAQFHITIDMISNYAITYQLLSDKEYMNGFIKNRESLLLNIQNIITMEYLDTKRKKVFVFENPSILTEILSKKMDISVIISGGFPNTSVYLLIDKLIESGNKVYYNGDFDPEGLLIAQKLKEKYQDKLELFCYSSKDYDSCISNKGISSSRLKKLSNVDRKELLEIKELLLNTKQSAYQEKNKERIIRCIEEII